MKIIRYLSITGVMPKSCMLLIVIMLGILLPSCEKPGIKEVKRAYPFDSGWKFNLGNPSGAERADFNDADWRQLDLPHDWSIEDLAPEQGATQVGPFSSASEGGGSTGHVRGGTGWYRKTFSIDPLSVNKQVSIVFDGVYMESDVWINGRYVGFHPYGYTPFAYDITQYLNTTGPKNIIAVRVNNPGRNSRWYSGSGIYRHVEMIITNHVHIAQWGNFVSTPEVSKEKAVVKIESTIENNTSKVQKVKVLTTLLTADGKTVATNETTQTLAPDSNKIIVQNISVTSPLLWSPTSPSLYTAVVQLKAGGSVSDQTMTHFGIRSISFDAQNGFLLNGEKVLLKGGCMHHDNGILGAAAIDRAEIRRVELMKKFGYNAIRTSHNPPSRPFLDACDRLGMLVIDEAFDMWGKAKKPEDYHRYFSDWHEKDLQSMILRDRNHPSVIIWSIGNEIPERADPPGLAIRPRLMKIVKDLDSTRPVTEAICAFWEQKGKPWKDTEAAFAGLDIGGYNYQWKMYEPDHSQFPNRIMAGTESTAREAFENWQAVLEKPYVIGDFLWTAMDYLGEAAIGNASTHPKGVKAMTPSWPWFNAWCGDIDICGFKKDQSYYRDVIWGISDLGMAVHAPVPAGQVESVSYWGWPDERQSWNWKGEEGKKLTVNVYSNYPEVRLELNGKIIDTKPVSRDTKLTATFEVPYQPGELKATGLKDGKESKTISLKTSGAPAMIRLTPDRNSIKASRNDLSYVTVELRDAAGNIVPDNDIPVTFTISGAGEAAGIGNANPSEMRSFKSPVCNTFRGRCLVILRPTGPAGEINLSAQAQGLKKATCMVVVN